MGKRRAMLKLLIAVSLFAALSSNALAGPAEEALQVVDDGLKHFPSPMLLPSLTFTSQTLCFWVLAVKPLSLRLKT